MKKAKNPSPYEAPNEVQDDEFEGSYRAFLNDYPQFEGTSAVDDIRMQEFSRLDADGHVYLDYTGGGLYSDSQVRKHSDLLLSRVFGNPHSSNPTSLGTTHLVERARARVMEFFNALPEEYTVVFTANASHALKLVGESYPFEPGDQFLLTFDNHNSVNGIREFDRVRGAMTNYVPVSPPDMNVDPAVLDRFLDKANPGGNNLFAFPAQSNFSGVQHPLDWVEQAHEKGWDVLLDAAAFVPTNKLDLGLCHPEYVAISFYKIFGYPTGIGALIARRDALRKLHRPWFAGGTITVASVQADVHHMARGASAFEDGTLDYTNLPAIEFGLGFIESVGLDIIHERVSCLSGWLVDHLCELHHRDGSPLIQLYGPRSRENCGGTVTINFFDRHGRVIDHEIVEERANKQMISLRTGCFCNPGAGELALGIPKNELVTCLSGSGSRMTYDDFRGCIDSEGTGAVRVSTGLVSNFRDVFLFVEFAKQFLDT